MGVPIEQLRVLEALSRSVSLPMGELAARVLVDPPSLTKIVDRMASESLVIRAPDPHDRRKVLVLLAPAGKVLLKRLRKVSRDLEQRLSAHLSRTKADALRSLLRDLVAGGAGR